MATRAIASGREIASGRAVASGRTVSSGREPTFSPTDISGLKLWLRAKSLSMVNGSAVASWYDESGQGNVALQSEPSKRPTFVTNVINGYPAVRFDWNNLQKLDLTTNITTAVGTMFAVVKNISAISDYHTIAAFDKLSLSAVLDTSLGWGTYAAVNLPYGGPPPNPGLLTVTVRADNDIDLRQNGGGQVNKTNGSAFAARGISVIGGAFDLQWLAGDLAEFVLYDSALSDTDRDRVEGYLRMKYAI